MADLNLNTVELTSTLRTAPLNGSPSSSDFNEGQREALVDFASIVGFINNQLLPLINALPEGALLPSLSPVGIEGRTIWTDTSDQSTLFFDALSTTPLTIADTLRVINGIVTTMRQQLIDQGVEVASLQARLASTNQNDIALALQNLSSALNQVSVTQQVQNTTITQLQGSKVVTARSTATSVSAGVTANVTVLFTPAFNDDFYTASVNLEADAPQGLVYAGAFQRDIVGLGLIVPVTNHSEDDVTVIVHVMAVHD